MSGAAPGSGAFRLAPNPMRAPPMPRRLLCPGISAAEMAAVPGDKPRRIGRVVGRAAARAPATRTRVSQRDDPRDMLDMQSRLEAQDTREQALAELAERYGIELDFGIEDDAEPAAA